MLKKYGIACLFPLMLLTACSSMELNQAEHKLPSSDNLLFVGHDDGDLDIYLTNMDTKEVIKLTQNSRDDVQPAWSPDGSKIVYASSEHGLYEIYTMNADGSGKQRITTNQSMELSPQWSPDGTSLVYISDRAGVEQIFRYDFATKKESQLTDSANSSINPFYSHDGKRIAYQERDGKKLYLNIMQADGSHAKKVLDKVTVNTFAWSPDSSQIAISGRKNRRTNIYVLDLASYELQQLTDTAYNDTEPTWLPDGRGLIFLSALEQHGESQINRLDLTDNSVTRLTHSNQAEMNVTVSADGAKLGFVRFERHFYHTYVLDLKSGNTEIIAESLTRAQMTPKFKPLGSSLM